MSVTVKKPRESKVRHVFGTAAKSQEHYNGIKYISPNAEANPLVANKTFFAFPWKGKGNVCVVNLKSVGAVPDDSPMLEQEDAVSDFAFSPFHDNFMAVSGDQNFTLWRFGEDGVQPGTQPLQTVENPHEKRMQNLSFHPLAENIMLTTAVDKTIKVWDLNHGGGASEKLNLPTHDGAVASFTWNYDGSLLATTAKDKYLRVLDPRSGSVVGQTICHEGAKASRGVWLGSKNQILTVGFVKGIPEREIAIFDSRNLGTRVYSQKIDAIPSGMFPYYDPDLSLLYVIGKGDGNIRMYEIVDGAEPLQDSGEFRSSVSQAGFAFLPKLSCDVMKCEIAKLLKLQDNTVVPIRFEVTRQNSGYVFQSDLYPDTWDNKPVYSADEWLSGEKRNPNIVKVNPQ